MDQVQQHRISRADVIRTAAENIVDEADATAEFVPNKRDDDGKDNPFLRITFVVDTWGTMAGLVEAATGDEDAESDLDAATLAEAILEGHIIMDTYQEPADGQ